MVRCAATDRPPARNLRSRVHRVAFIGRDVRRGGAMMVRGTAGLPAGRGRMLRDGQPRADTNSGAAGGARSEGL